TGIARSVDFDRRNAIQGRPGKMYLRFAAPPPDRDRERGERGWKIADSQPVEVISAAAVGGVAHLDEIFTCFLEGVRQSGVRLQARGIVAVKPGYFTARFCVMKQDNGVEGGTEPPAEHFERQPLPRLHAEFEIVAHLDFGSAHYDARHR